MENELPDGLLVDIRIAVLRALESVTAAGWTISAVKWQNKSDRILEFSAHNPSTGTRVYVMCDDINLEEQLRKLISK